MANPHDKTLPGPGEALFPGGKSPSVPWRNFFEAMSRQPGLTTDQSAEIAALAERVTTLEEATESLGSILGLGSVSAVGTLGDQIVIQLVGDEANPAALSTYGTDADGVRGWYVPPDRTPPYFIPADETFTVAANKQALFTMPIDVEGFLDVEGYLVEVG